MLDNNSIDEHEDQKIREGFAIVGICYFPEGLCRREDKSFNQLEIFHADGVGRPGFKDI